MSRIGIHGTYVFVGHVLKLRRQVIILRKTKQRNILQVLFVVLTLVWQPDRQADTNLINICIKIIKSTSGKKSDLSFFQGWSLFGDIFMKSSPYFIEIKNSMNPIRFYCCHRDVKYHEWPAVLFNPSWLPFRIVPKFTKINSHSRSQLKTIMLHAIARAIIFSGCLLDGN